MPGTEYGTAFVLGTPALGRAPLMARRLNLPGPLFSYLKNGDHFNKVVARTNPLTQCLA